MHTVCVGMYYVCVYVHVCEYVCVYVCVYVCDLIHTKNRLCCAQKTPAGFRGWAKEHPTQPRFGLFLTTLHR